MPTALVAGRVEIEKKERADYYIRRAGLTTSDVIRIVWTNIADTGEIPQLAAEYDSSNTPSLADRMRTLRKKTPHSEFLEHLTPEDLKRELENRA